MWLNSKLWKKRNLGNDFLKNIFLCFVYVSQKSKKERIKRERERGALLDQIGSKIILLLITEKKTPEPVLWYFYCI